jgi:hypothetical protein
LHEKRITHIAVHKTSFVLAICITSAFLLVAVVQLPRALTHSDEQTVGRLSSLLLMPLLFGLGCYLLGLVFFLIYNFIAKRFGGIEIQLDYSDAA